MNDIIFTEKIKKYVDGKYCFGDSSKGWDCITLIFDFYSSCGCSLPKEYKGWDLNNYAQKWQQGEGRDTIKEFLLSLGSPVKNNFQLAGDLMIFETEAVFPGIYLGSQHVLMAFEKRVMVVPFKFFKDNLIAIRRLF